jgi:protein subunit release factor B
MNCERGTHRLARVSPFNAEGKRQTSFATVDVSPEFEETDLEIPAKDLEIVPFVRASGPGGQNVNKVATAIRVTHIPTGIQVVASTFRDQPQNRKQAMSVLRGKLEQIEEERRAAEIVDRGVQFRQMIVEGGMRRIGAGVDPVRHEDAAAARRSTLRSMHRSELRLGRNIR